MPTFKIRDEIAMIVFLIRRTDGEWFEFPRDSDPYRPIDIAYRRIESDSVEMIEVDGCRISFSFEDPGIQVTFEGEISESRAMDVAKEIQQRIEQASGQTAETIQISGGEPTTESELMWLNEHRMKFEREAFPMFTFRTAIIWIGGILGLWLTFDGARALVTGEYVTPKAGPHAGQLGPWAGIVRALGLEPKSTAVKCVHVMLGLAWLVSLAGFALRANWGRSALMVCSVASLWYLPVGTVIGGVILAILSTALRR